MSKLKIGIIGLGLIGGSLGLDLRTQGYQVMGVSQKSATCKQAVELGAVDQASMGLDLLENADLIFICTPIGAIAPTLEKLIPHLNSSTVVTDVGSVKQPIVRACGQMWPLFVGSHPMAGTEASGIRAAQRNLFAHQPWVITPTADTPETAINLVKTVVRPLQARIYTCTPLIHDCAVAWISHLPVIISANLIHSCTNQSDSEVLELAMQLASSGFRDTSRVGGGNPELGLMMAQYNRQQLLHSLRQYRQGLDQIIAQIEQQDWHSLATILQSTQQSRSRFL